MSREYSERAKKLKKKMYVESLLKHMGVQTPALEEVKIDHLTIKKWREEDKDFDELCFQARYVIPIDFAESKLNKLIKDGDFRAIKYFLNCRGRERGWADRQEITQTITEPVKINIIEEKEDGEDMHNNTEQEQK